MPGRCSAPRLRDVGDQHHAAHQVLHRLGQVVGRLQRVDHGQQRVGVFEVVALEVQVQQRQRLHQRRVVAGHQPRKAVLRRGEAGDPREDGFRRHGFLVELEDPGVEPVAPGDGLRQLGVAALHQRLQLGGVEAGRQRPRIDVDHARPPLRRQHRLRLQQHAAQVAVERAHVQRLQRRGHAVEQRLQTLDVVFGQWGRRGGRRGHRRDHAADAAPGAGPIPARLGTLGKPRSPGMAAGAAGAYSRSRLQAPWDAPR